MVAGPVVRPDRGDGKVGVPWIQVGEYAKLPVMLRRRNERAAPLTGPDVLIVMAEQYRKSGAVDPAMAEAFFEMLSDWMGASLTTTEPGRRVSQRPLDPDEQTAMAIVGTAIDYAKDRADEETYVEVVRVGISLAIKFREYLDATGRR